MQDTLSVGALLVSLLLVAGAAAGENTEDTNPVWSPDGASIVFYSYRDGNAQLYGVSPNGSGERRLTRTTTFEMFPAPSGDGSRWVFVSDRDGERRFQMMEVYAMEAGGDGTEARRLTRHEGLVVFPALSPDGRTITYTRVVGGFESGDLWAIDADGSNARRLTDTPGALDRAARWSPDGTRIAFDSNREGNFDVYVMNADGSEVRRITDAPGYDALPSFSPDGRSLVYESSPEKAPNGMTPPAGADLYVIDLDSGERRRLTQDAEVYDGHGSWSPDGTEIAFHTLRHGEHKEIYVVRLADLEQRRLTFTNAHASGD